MDPQGPSSAPPPGVVSQFPTTHSDEQAWFYVSATLSAVVPGTLLLLRLYTKLRVVRKVDVTDYLTTLSFLFLIALIICTRFCIAEGAGVHQWNLPLHNFIRLNYWLWISQILYAPTLFLAKTTILVQYIRLFAPQKTVDPFMWYSARIVIVVTGVWYIITVVIIIFACSPQEAVWNLLITEDHCVDNNALILSTCIFNIISDVIILILPTRAVWRLRIPTRNKIRIVLLFAVGLLACIATVMIIVYLERTEGENADVSYNAAWLSLWGIAEISFGITVTGAFLLPKFIEAEGAKLRGFFSSLTRPFTSVTSGVGLGTFMHSKKESISSQEVALDQVTMIEHSESDVGFIGRDHDVERYPSYEGVHNSVKYPSVKATDQPHRFRI